MNGVLEAHLLISIIVRRIAESCSNAIVRLAGRMWIVMLPVNPTTLTDASHVLLVLAVVEGIEIIFADAAH